MRALSIAGMDRTEAPAIVAPLSLPEEDCLSSPKSIKRHLENGDDVIQLLATVPSLDSVESVENYVRESLTSLEDRLEAVLDGMSEELANEVSRERQHLILMQEQVDKQSRALQHEFTEIHKAIEQEKTARALVQHSSKEQSEQMSQNLAAIARELAEVRYLVSRMSPQTPWIYRMFNNVRGLFCQCAPASYVRLSS